MEHELSAIYDITPGLGLAILTPRWMEYCLDQNNVSRYVQFAINVFGVNADMDLMSVAREGINRLSQFLFGTLGLKSTFTEVGIKAEDFPVMARKSCGGGVLEGFKPLRQDDIEKIFQMCL